MSNARTIPAAVGVCVPIHNEEQTLRRSLRALERAAKRAEIKGIGCRIAAVLDDCSDLSALLLDEWSRRADIPTLTIECNVRNVGVARQMGFTALIDASDQVDPEQLWLATTDADSEVPANWLTHQIDCRRQKVQFWAGRVKVTDWLHRQDSTANLWKETYRTEQAPIHGANLGISADLFLRVGGFPPLPTGEDHALLQAVTREGSTVCHDWRAAVVTSSRKSARAPAGFAHFLNRLERQMAQL
jgi:Glycosyl transferase family 2